MDEFEFELLKVDLLTQPVEKEGNQLFQRKVSTLSTWVENVSRRVDKISQARDPKAISTGCFPSYMFLIASPDCSQLKTHFAVSLDAADLARGTFINFGFHRNEIIQLVTEVV